MNEPPLRPDYESLARDYDADREHFRIPPDDVIAEAAARRPMRVLDVGCGTGLWLKAQTGYFPGDHVRWVGLDLSVAMLGRAADKRTPARLVRGRAEHLPFVDASFDYVFSSYAYHQFDDKLAAFDEIARITKPGAVFRIRHMDSFNKQDWWIYRFFPNTRDIDAKRFWPTDKLQAAIEERGFDVDVKLIHDPDLSTKADVLAVAERRITSQLAILDDASYEEGMKRLRELDPDTPFETERGASLWLTATKA